LFYGNDQGFEFSGLSFDPLAVGWGVTATDFDLDGKEDLAIANGDTTPSRNTPLEVFSRRLFRVDQLYKNVGDSFGDVTWQTLCPPSQSGRPLAVADYDNDGDEDIFIGNLAYEKTGDELYVSKGTEMSNFLSVSLEGKESNRMGIGTQVSVVTAGGKRLTKWVRAGGSFYSQNSTRLIFGLGNLDTAVALEILWPSGRKSYFESVVVNQHIKIQEGSSDIVSR